MDGCNGHARDPRRGFHLRFSLELMLHRLNDFIVNLRFICAAQRCCSGISGALKFNA